MEDLIAQCTAGGTFVGKAVLVIAALNALSHGLDWVATKTAWKGDDSAAQTLHDLVVKAKWLVDFVIAKQRSQAGAPDGGVKAKAGEDRSDRGA